jgi:hypothetical protein
MKNVMKDLVEKNFGKIPQTFRQLEQLYTEHVKGETVVIVGAGRNTIDAAQGMIPLFTRKKE